MDQKRLTELIQSHQDMLLAHPEDRTPHEVILSIFGGLDRGEITLAQALRLLGYQALRLDDSAAHQALYRQAAADLRQMGHEE